MIRQALIDWKKATKKLSTILMIKEVEKRDEVIETVVQLLDVREQLQHDIQAPFTKEEEVFAKEILQLEKVFQERIHDYFHSIRKDLSEAKSKKAHMRRYINPYRNVSQDGAYYDTKQ